MSVGRVLAEHLGRGRRVDVLAAREGLAQLRLAGDVGEDAQLDLRVVGREQPVPRLGDERRADLAAELGADRNRLEVRVRRREPARRGDRLVEGRVQAAVLGDQARQRPEVRVQRASSTRATPRSRRRSRARPGSSGERACRSSSRSSPCGPGVSSSFSNRIRATCWVEPIMNSSPASSYARDSSSSTRSAQARRDLAHPVRVDLDARALHRGEDRRERELDSR